MPLVFPIALKEGRTIPNVAIVVLEELAVEMEQSLPHAAHPIKTSVDASQAELFAPDELPMEPTSNQLLELATQRALEFAHTIPTLTSGSSVQLEPLVASLPTTLPLAAHLIKLAIA